MVLLQKYLGNVIQLKRPVHCGDAKKEIIYVKDEDRYEYIKTVAEVLKEPREDKKIISDVAKEMLVTS